MHQTAAAPARWWAPWRGCTARAPPGHVRVRVGSRVRVGVRVGVRGGVRVRVSVGVRVR